jgi:hypothetical protein
VNALEKLNFLISTYGRLLVALFNVRLWPPFLLYLAVTILLVYMIQSMFSPLLSGWLIPLVIAVSSEQVLHYPQHLVMLPSVFQWLNVVPSLLVESVLMATAILMFAAYFGGKKPRFRDSLKEAFQHYPRIVLVWFVNFVLVLVLFLVLPELFRDFTVGSPRRQMALTVGMQGLSALLTSLFIYAIPLLTIARESLAGAFLGSFRLFFRNFFTTYLLVVIPQILIMAVSLLLQNYDTIIDKFHPRVMLGLTYFYGMCLVFTNFFVFGAIVRFLLRISSED